jgi:protoporphyrinogen/coproporphyrinogen III oxidase
MMENKKETVVVIGGGIAGLSAAYYLQKSVADAGLAWRVRLLEASDRLGGKIRTERVNGFVIEGGPDTFLASKPWATQLCRELGLYERLQGTNPSQKSTYVLRAGRLQPLPDGLTMMIPTNIASMLQTKLLSWPAKFRMGLDWFIPAKPLDGDESLGAFVSRRLGRSAYENLIEPLMSGIYAGDGDALSLQATFPYLRDLESNHGGLVKGALNTRKSMAKNGRIPSGSRSAFLTPQTGLQEIVDALVGRLEREGCEISTSQPVERLGWNGENYQIQPVVGPAIAADAVILATPAYQSAQILEDLAPDLALELNAIPYVNAATVSLAYEQSELGHPLNGYGYVIPRKEGQRALACTWTSTKFPHRAPEGKALVRVFFGRAGEGFEVPTSEADLVQLARAELAQTLQLHAEPLLGRAFYWEKAMPQYNLGHPERLARMEEHLKGFPGLALAGNAFRGIGIPDCIHSGQDAARKILEQVKYGNEDTKISAIL